MCEKVEAEESKPQQQQPTRKPVRQPPSVPFIWEQRPGLPKKNWKPNPATAAEAAESEAAAASHTPPPPLPPPVKMVASVPFAWEETPGKPLPCFADDPSPESLDPPPELLCLPLPPMYTNHDIGDEFDDTNSDTDYISSDSFSSAPSLLAANCLVSSDAVSGAVPVDEFDDLKKEAMLLPTSPAYESDDSTSSYMTGASSLVGASFLEKLFPLLPPDSGLVRNVPTDSDDVSVSHALAEVKPRASDTNFSFPVRKPPTLGELKAGIFREWSCQMLPLCARHQNDRSTGVEEVPTEAEAHLEGNSDASVRGSVSQGSCCHLPHHCPCPRASLEVYFSYSSIPWSS